MLNINLYNLVIDIINVIILFVILKKFLIGPVTAIMEKREAEIDGSFGEANKAKTQALEIKEEYEKSMRTTHEESERILEAAKEYAEKEQERILKDAELKAEKIVSDAKKTVSMEQEKALWELEAEVAGLAMAAVAKIMGEQEKDRTDAALYNQFIAKVGEPHDTNSY